jgi:hypothetical protein
MAAVNKSIVTHRLESIARSLCDVVIKLISVFILRKSRRQLLLIVNINQRYSPFFDKSSLNYQ